MRKISSPSKVRRWRRQELRRRRLTRLRFRYKIWKQWVSSSYEAQHNSMAKNICVFLNIGDTFAFDIYRSVWRDLM